MLFRIKPFKIEAIQYIGTLSEELRNWLDAQGLTWDFSGGQGLRIATLEGVLVVKPYSWIQIWPDQSITNEDHSTFLDKWDLVDE